MKSNLKRPLITGLLIGIFIILIFSSGYFYSLELRTSDKLQGGIKPLDKITIIAIDEHSIMELGKFPWSRDIYAKLLNNLDAKVIGFDIGFFESTEEDMLFDQTIKTAQNNNISIIMTEEITNNNVLKPIFNVTTGYSNLLLDGDGVLRNVPFYLEGMPFSYEIAKSIKPVSYPKEAKIRFANKPYSFNQISFIDALNSKEKIQNDIIIIGTTASDLHDEYNVPTSKGKLMPGVEIHANIIQMLLQKSFIFETSNIINWMIILATSLLGSILIWLSLPKRIWLIVLEIIFIPIYFLITIICFNKGLLVPIISPIIGFITSNIGSGIVWSYSEQNQKRIIKKAFEKYVSPNIVKEIIKNPTNLKLGGQKRKLSILFSDIRGFTTLSEKVKAEELVTFLNDYLSLMTKIVLEKKGLVDKFIGDAVMALWNTPFEQKKHALLACETALEMKRILKTKPFKGLFKDLKIGIGIHTGEAVVGNLGSEERFDYTAIGDNVNLASRLEGLTKAYGVSIIISETTKVQVDSKLKTRLLDKVQVKGKKKAIQIYELVKEKNKTHEIYEEALNLYFKGKFKEAKKLFIKNKNDKTSKIMIERCDILIKSKKRWNGIWEHKNK